MTTINLGDVIFLIHVSMFIFLLFAPFCTTKLKWIQVHILSLLCILIHWYLNDNTCCLTLMEIYARRAAGENVTYNDTFFSKIFNPVYQIPDHLTLYFFIQFTLLCCINHMNLIKC